MSMIDYDRRKWLTLGGVALGLVLIPGQSLATLSTPRPRALVVNNLHTGERLKAEFFDGKEYNLEELHRLNYLFRDHRSNQVTSIDPQLFDQLFRLQMMLGSRKAVQLVSGYRSLATNKKLRAASSGVAKKSYHTRGKAMDFYIEGIPLKTVHQAALKMTAGGVGYYPKSHFVHIDTGPVRKW